MTFPRPDTQIKAEIDDIQKAVDEEIAFRRELEQAKDVLARRGFLATIVSGEPGAECARVVLYDAIKTLVSEFPALIPRIEEEAVKQFKVNEDIIIAKLHVAIAKLARHTYPNSEDA
jgi:hypothetical protein